MRGLRLLLVIAAVVAITIGSGRMAAAFHAGGVAECVGCHSLHEPVGPDLLKGSDISSTCLICHGKTGASSYHISTPDADMPTGTPPGNMTPGGDFGWLKKTYTWTGYGGVVETELGERHGHNIVAADFGHAADSTNTTAPMGTFDANYLACNSCHDNHGEYRRLEGGTIVKTGAPIANSGSYNNSADPTATTAVGVYRLLVGKGYNSSGQVTFSVDPPAAVVPSTYNRTEATTDTRAAYGKGMVAWCKSCHSSYNGHPAGITFGGTIAANYNAYVKSGDMTGTSATSFDSLVNFEENTDDYATLKPHAKNDGSYTTGPSSSAVVTCLTCHRAHASGWLHMTRWNNEKEYIIVGGEWPGTDATYSGAKSATTAQGRLKAETKKAYYDRPETRYATTQRALCNKCHAWD